MRKRMFSLSYVEGGEYMKISKLCHHFLLCGAANHGSSTGIVEDELLNHGYSTKAMSNLPVITSVIAIKMKHICAVVFQF